MFQMKNWDILTKINDFATKYNIPVDNLKSKVSREIAKDFAAQEEDTYLSENSVESAFEKVIKKMIEK